LDLPNQDQLGGKEEAGGRAYREKYMLTSEKCQSPSFVVLRAFQEFMDFVPYCLPERKDPPDFQLKYYPTFPHSCPLFQTVLELWG
jgi:hypothetical protein